MGTPERPGWRRCTRCGHEGPPEDFTRGHGGKPTTRCHSCTNECRRRWYENNRELHRASVQRYLSRPGIRERENKKKRLYAARRRAGEQRAAGLPYVYVPRGPRLTPEHRKAHELEYRRRYYWRNREASLERKRRWVEAHREQEKARKAAWYQANKERIAAHQREFRLTKRKRGKEAKE